MQFTPAFKLLDLIYLNLDLDLIFFLIWLRMWSGMIVWFVNVGFWNKLKTTVIDRDNKSLV